MAPYLPRASHGQFLRIHHGAQQSFQRQTARSRYVPWGGCPGQDLAVREGTAAGSTNLTRASKRVTGKAGYAVDTPYIIVTRVSGCGYVPTWYKVIWIWQYGCARVKHGRHARGRGTGADGKGPRAWGHGCARALRTPLTLHARSFFRRVVVPGVAQRVPRRVHDPDARARTGAQTDADQGCHACCSKPGCAPVAW